jgi:hypothetical protein
MRARVCLAVLVCLLLTLPVVAQKFTGTIRGAVTDASGAVVPNAEVTITNEGTSDTRTVTTNDQGEYVVLEMPAGMYTVSVKKSGFKQAINRGVELHVASTVVSNAMLQVGNVSEEVTVEANAVQVETSTGAVGNVIEGNSVRELPLNGRSFTQLTQLMPGVSPDRTFNSKNKGLMAGVDFSVNGNNTTGNLFLVDGVNNNDIGSNRTILVYPSIDAIQEFKILRNSYPPEYGQAMGAIINIITRGGTNSFHGGAFYFGRNDKLNATDYFNNLNGIPKDVLRRNDWGYDIGGPIVKDKLFFFWSQEWNRELRGQARAANVPTVAEKAGDFSQLRLAGCENTPMIGGNPVTAVPAGQISTFGSLMVQLFPDPNIPQNPATCNNWAQSLTAPIYWRQEHVRIDYNLTNTWRLFGRYTQDHWSQPFPSTLGFWGDDIYPSVETSWIQPGYQATIKLTKIFGTSAVNDFQVSYAANRITANRAGTNPGLNDQILAATAPNLTFPISDKFFGLQSGYPIFWGGLGNGANSDNLWTQAPWHNNEQLFIFKDDFSKVVGTHTFKVGFLATNNQKNELVNGSDGDMPQFWGAASNDTGNGTFNALWNQVSWGFSELQHNPFTETRWHDFEWYFGDTWKVRRNVTFEYGIRWSFLRQPYAAKDAIANFQASAYDPALGADPCNGLLLVPGTNFCQAAGFLGGVQGPNRSLKANDNHSIAPRLGIAWDPKGDGKMSIRAGVGQFYQRERLTNYLQVATNPPFSLSAGGDRVFDAPPGALSASGTPGFGMDMSHNIPNTWQWNLTVERELFRDTKLELAYVGNRGIHILRYQDANAVPASLRQTFAIQNSNVVRPFGVDNNCGTDPPPCGHWGSINSAAWTAGSNYNGLQALFRTRLRGLDAQFAYTWSKSLSDTDITNSGTSSQAASLVDVTNPRHDYGPTLINRPHIFTANLVYNLPEFRGHGAPTRYVLGGWELASILNYTSGPSITIYDTSSGTPTGAPGGFAGLGTGQNSNRPNRVAGEPCRPSGAPKFQWLNPNAWTMDNYVLGSLGNDSVGSCAGPGIANTDFSLYKNFKLTERVGLQFRMEFYNLFNTPQFRADQVNLNLSTGGFACVAGNVGDSSFAARCPNGVTNAVSWIRSSDQAQNFGQVHGPDRGPREIQYALKITF